MKKKILISSDLPREPFKELMERFEVFFPKGQRFTKEELADILPQVEGIITTYGFKIRPQVIDQAPNLKVIANYGVGYDNIDVEYATRKGIVVTNNPSPVTRPTVEHTIGLMIAVAHRIPESDKDIRKGCADWSEMSYMGHSLFGKKLGIVGMGRIGKMMADYARVFGMDVIYYSRTRLAAEVEQELNVSYLPMERLLGEADFVSVHVPSTPQTRHMFDADAFRRMKRTAYFINAARGAVMDESALADALRDGEIAGAAVDVFEFEPKVTEALLGLDNIVMTPHTGTNTWEGRYGMSYCAARNVIRFFEGSTEIDRVN